MQTDAQKNEIVMDFAVNHQPKLFPLLAPTDHNVAYFQSILDANWQAEFSIKWLRDAVNHFKDKFQWLQEPAGKPVLTRAQQRAELGLPEESWREERWDVKAARLKKEEEGAKKAFQSDPKNITRVKEKAEELARTANIGSHSDNAAFRKLLSETFAHENGKLSWLRTLELREQLYKNATSGSVK
jgi:hypothetical protein